MLRGTPRKNMHILISSGVRGDTRRYRVFHLYEQCHILGLDVHLSHIIDLGFINKVKESDLLILHRAPWDSNVQRAIDNIHNRGGKVIYDTDDLLFDLKAFQWIDSPDFTDPVRANLYREDMSRQRKTMDLSDAIMTSTGYLAEQAGLYKQPVFMHHNGFSKQMLAASERVLNNKKLQSKKNVILGYASGTFTHNRDFDSIRPVLTKILDEKEHVTLWLVGKIELNRDWQEQRNRILRMPHVPWRLLPGYLASFDINLAPLVVDNPFAQSKSEIKWMEAALVKVPTIASPVRAFNDVIKNGKNGFLATTQDDWYRALSMLVDSPDIRAKVGEAAYEQVIHTYSPQVCAEEFLTILKRIIPEKKIGTKTAAGKKSGQENLQEHEQNDLEEINYLEYSPSIFMQAIYSLRHRGLTTLIKQIWVFLRRLISPIIPYRKSRNQY